MSLARHLQITHPAVTHWIAAGRVPVDRVPTILRLALEHGVELSAEDICPDVDWDAVRRSATADVIEGEAGADIG